MLYSAWERNWEVVDNLAPVNSRTISDPDAPLDLRPILMFAPGGAILPPRPHDVRASARSERQ
jgi:hypothetical protein